MRQPQSTGSSPIGYGAGWFVIEGDTVLLYAQSRHHPHLEVRGRNASRTRKVSYSCLASGPQAGGKSPRPFFFFLTGYAPASLRRVLQRVLLAVRDFHEERRDRGRARRLTCHMTPRRVGHRRCDQPGSTTDYQHQPHPDFLLANSRRGERGNSADRLLGHVLGQFEGPLDSCPPLGYLRMFRISCFSQSSIVSSMSADTATSQSAYLA